jgi:hypothetical protein
MLTGFVIGDRGLGASGDTHPFWVMAYAMAGPYLVVGASAIGQFHLAQGLPRDDAFVIRAVGPWLAAAVADGVGLRPFSRYGATYAVEALTALLLRPLVHKVTPGEKSVARPLSSHRSRLSPPPTVEETELKIPVVKKGSTAWAMGIVLGEWTKKVEEWTRKVLGGAEFSPPTEFRQAASVGWWTLSSTDQQPEEVSLPDQSPASVVANSQGKTADRSPSNLNEPNLVEIVKQAFRETHLGLREHASRLDLALADLSCTALALLLNVETGKGAVGQVGDGAILGLTARGEVLELIHAPDTGDPQRTYTLTKPNFEHYLAVGIIERPAADPFVAFYLMTDGLSGDLLYSPQHELLKDWAQKVDRNLRLSPSLAQAAAGMLHWLATYQVKGSWDDRTLVVITQKEGRSDGNRQPAAGQQEFAVATDDQ